MRIRIRAGSGGGRRGAWLGAAFLVLFGTAFAAMGLVAGWASHREEPDSWLPLVFGGAFVGFGLLVIALAVFGLRRLYARKALREERAATPWLWRDDWASGRIEGGSRRAAVAMGIFAGLWNLVAWPGAVAGWRAVQRGEAERAALLLAAAFPLVGLGLAAAAVYLALRWRRFGRSVLELKTLPGVLGGPFRAILHAGPGLAGASEVRLTLENLRRYVSGSGKHRTTHEHLYWQHVRTVDRGSLGVAGGTQVPVEFRVPFDCRESSEDDPDDRIVWRLRVQAGLPGIDYAESFEVPVFRTPESSEEVTGDEEAIPALAATPLGGGEALPGSAIRVRPWGAGGREITFGMLRHPGSAALLALFTAVFGGATGLLLTRADAPWFFTAIFGLFTALIAWATLGVAFRRTVVRVEPGRICVRGGLFGLGRLREIPSHEVERIEARRGMQSGNRLYYDLRIRRRSGGPVAAGSMIPDRLEAEALARAMAGTLGLDAPYAP